MNALSIFEIDNTTSFQSSERIQPTEGANRDYVSDYKVVTVSLKCMKTRFAYWQWHKTKVRTATKNVSGRPRTSQNAASPCWAWQLVHSIVFWTECQGSPSVLSMTINATHTRLVFEQHKKTIANDKVDSKYLSEVSTSSIYKPVSFGHLSVWHGTVPHNEETLKNIIYTDQIHDRKTVAQQANNSLTPRDFHTENVRSKLGDLHITNSHRVAKIIRATENFVRPLCESSNILHFLERGVDPFRACTSSKFANASLR